MMNVRYELIDALVSNFGCGRPQATKAVDKAIEADMVSIDPEDSEKVVQEVANLIYSNILLWEWK